jgi:hypothetical protein
MTTRARPDDEIIDDLRSAFTGGTPDLARRLHAQLAAAAEREGLLDVA